jgi:hypothetical protein
MQIRILVVGRHPEIMETVLRLLASQPGWSAEGARTDEEAMDKFRSAHFDLVLIGGGVAPASEDRLRADFMQLRPDVKMVRHYGGGSGLLFNEVRQALALE